MRTSKNALPIRLTAFLALALPAPAAPAAMKCWTNKEGIKECGNVVPPEYADEERVEFGKHGVVTGHKERAKTAEEIEAEKARAAEEAARKAEEERRRREQEAADRVLLETFGSEDDMIMSRDGRLAHIEATIKVTQSQIEKLQKNIDDLIAQAAERERRGEDPGTKVEQDIENLRKQVAEKQAFIASKRAEQDAIRKQFEADIARFRELKAKQAP